MPYAAQFNAAGAKHGISPFLLAAQARHESIQFKPEVIDCRQASPAGAKGISQFMDATAASWKVNPCDPHSAIDGQARFMKALIHKFGRVEWALAAYNAGPGAVLKYNGIPPYRETQKYVPIVLRYQAEMEAGA